jgi:hypothetical protein
LRVIAPARVEGRGRTANDVFGGVAHVTIRLSFLGRKRSKLAAHHPVIEPVSGRNVYRPVLY